MGQAGKKIAIRRIPYRNICKSLCKKKIARRRALPFFLRPLNLDSLGCVFAAPHSQAIGSIRIFPPSFSKFIVSCYGCISCLFTYN